MEEKTTVNKNDYPEKMSLTELSMALCDSVTLYLKINKADKGFKTEELLKIVGLLEVMSLNYKEQLLQAGIKETIEA